MSSYPFIISIFIVLSVLTVSSVITNSGLTAKVSNYKTKRTLNNCMRKVDCYA